MLLELFTGNAKNEEEPTTGHQHLRVPASPFPRPHPEPLGNPTFQDTVSLPLPPALLEGVLSVWTIYGLLRVCLADWPEHLSLRHQPRLSRFHVQAVTRPIRFAVG